jgi:predicted CXXCH cytochrome family protein
MVPAFPLTGTGGQPYSADLFGNIFSWTDSTINIQGFCTISLYTDPTNCANGGGVWLSGSKPLYYIYGGWMNATPRALYDGSYTQGGQKTAVSYSCGRCHTTGFTMDTAIRSAGGVCSFVPGTGFVCRTPEVYFPGITWTPTNTTGKIDLDPDGNGPAISSSWAVNANTGQSLEGVQCERCHNSTFGHTPAIIQKGPAATALCLQCHRQEHIVSYTTGSTGANIHPTPATDNASLPISEPLYALPAIEVGHSDGSYAPVFYDYSTGMEYLNSVHGQFTGNFQQINDFSKYLSSFVTSSVDGGCTKCHDVHQSTVAAVNAAAPYKKNCPDCHQEGSTSGLSTMFHPNGPGTPMGGATSIPAGCAKCHMPKPNNGEGRSSHIWRISTDPSYTTFPTQTQWDAGQKTALSAPTGTYTNAVWIDLDLACGQCHGASDPVQRPATHYFNKPALATKATGMHAGSPWSTVCTGCHTNGGDPVAPQINPGVDHHSGGCTGCHTNPGIAQFDQTPASCNSCHIYENMATMNHPTGGPTPATCTGCHFAPGVPVSALGLQAVCGQCHGGSSNETHNGAPYFTPAELTTYATNMHNTLPTASFAWQTDATKDYKILFNGSSSTCPSGATCTYTWSTGETGVTASHTFPNGTTTTVTLTVTSSTGFDGSVSKAVTPVYMAEHPTSLGAGLTVTPGGYTPTVNWTVSGGVAPYTVRVNWGDGTTVPVTQPAAGPGSMSHTYAIANTYTVSVYVIDSGVNGSNQTSATATTSVTIVPSSTTVSGRVTRSNGTTPISTVAMTLKQGTVVKKLAYTDASGNYTMTGVAAGNYTLTATKSGYTFPAPVPVPVGAVPVTVNISSTTP